MTTTPTPFGSQTNSTMVKIESHKLHESFSVADDTGDVYVGQPVKLDPDNDGIILALDPDDNAKLCIGISIHDTDIASFNAGVTPQNSMRDSYSLKKATVAMAAYAIVICLADTNYDSSVSGVIPGPVKYTGFEADDELFFPQKGRSKYANVDMTDPSDVALMVGWALHSADEADEVKVALCR